MTDYLRLLLRRLLGYLVCLALAIFVTGCRNAIQVGNEIPPSIADPACEGVGVWKDSEAGLCWQDPPNETNINWQKAKDYCSNLSHAGTTDWRLPLIQELLSLIRGCDQSACALSDPDCLYNNGDIGCDSDCNHCDSKSGPGPGGCYWDSQMTGPCTDNVSWQGGRGSYWSSSLMSNDQDGVWRVMFGSGSVDLTGRNKQDDEVIYARCVRSLPPVQGPDGGLDAGDNGIVDPAMPDCAGGKRDPQTGLCWQFPPATEQVQRWSKAQIFCNDLSIESHDDWRLPTIGELRTLVRGNPPTEYNGSCKVSDGLGEESWSNDCVGGERFGGTGKGGCYWETALSYYCDEPGIWSSSLHGDAADRGWWISFETAGIAFDEIEDFYAGHHVMCVRLDP